MLSGYTGPSGALDLGLTGPTGDNNPRIFEGDDKYVIPSGSTGVFWSISESEYRVNWRNWDQEMLIINFGPLHCQMPGLFKKSQSICLMTLGKELNEIIGV